MRYKHGSGFEKPPMFLHNLSNNTFFVKPYGTHSAQTTYYVHR